MNALRAAAVAVVVLALVVAAGYAVFGFVLVSSDRASYTANATTAFDYDAVVANASAAGYDVETVDSFGFHPSEPANLEAALGPNYEVVRVVFYGPDGWRFEANVFADEGRTELVAFDPDFDPVDPAALPEDWLVDRIQLVLGVEAARAEGYVDEMRAAVTDDDVAIPQTYADERLEFADVYAALEGDRDDRSVTTGTPGQGWTEYHYARNGQPTGELHFVVERAQLTDREGNWAYRVTVDRNGGVGVEIVGPAGADRDEADLRAALRERFTTLGIPPTVADDLTFAYDSSVW